MNIENTLQILAFGGALRKVVENVQADGKYNASDISELFSLVPTMGPAFEDIDQIPSELEDLDKEEIAQLQEAVVDVLGPNVNATVEAQTRSIFNLVVAFSETVKLFKYEVPEESPEA